MSKKRVLCVPPCGYELYRAKDETLLYTYNQGDFMATVLRYMDNPEADGWDYFVDSIHNVDFTDIILN